MAGVDTIENISTAFLWGSKEALPLMKKSINEDKYCPAFESRAFFLAQAVSSCVAIPFILLASVFIMLWKMCHCEFREAFYTLPAAIIFSAFHFCAIFGATVATVAPMSWTEKSIDCFEFKKPDILDPSAREEHHGA